jgi:protein-tyrosine-phosphatase
MGETIPLLLFVCVENSGRSQMAEGFARALGNGRVQAFSAGSKPSGHVHPTAVRLMAEKGVDLGPQRSKGLDDLPPGIQWDYVVTMGCGDACPHLPARHRLDWDLPDPKSMDDEAFRHVRDQIEERVRRLIEEAGSESVSDKRSPASGDESAR